MMLGQGRVRQGRAGQAGHEECKPALYNTVYGTYAVHSRIMLQEVTKTTRLHTQSAAGEVCSSVECIYSSLRLSHLQC